MRPPNRESVAEIARDTGITAQTLYNWRSQGQLLPASPRPPAQWGAADKLAAVIQAAGLRGTELGTFWCKRCSSPRQVARWRQAAEDANGPSALSMADQRELQRKNQELIRPNRQLEPELQKKEKAPTEVATLLWPNASAKRLLSKKIHQIFQSDEEH